MTFRAWALAGTASVMALSGIVSASAQVPDPQASESQPTTGPTSVFLPPANPVPPLDERSREALRRALKTDQRIDVQRDRWRNPEATLQFFGVRASDTVIEIWPGQGWYTSILGPYLRQGEGKLIVGHFDAAASNSLVVRQMVDAYRARFAVDTAVFGNVTVVPFGPRSMLMAAPNSVDKVLTFRNIHNWMAQGWTEKAFADFYTVLKPGGILGIEEHRGRTDEPQDPLARDGYVREDYVIQLAREAGFEFIGGAEINANPADTKDHPFGVWTLPPVSRTSPIGQIDDPGFDRRRYDEIGESDRMTLRFRKPLDATGIGLASSRPTADQIPVTIIPGPPPPPRRGRRGAPPPPPPVAAGVEIKPDSPVSTPSVEPKAGVTVAPEAAGRSAPQEPEAKAPPPPASPPPASVRRGSTAKKEPRPASTPASAPAAAPSDAAGAKPADVAPPQPPTSEAKPKATTEPASTQTPTALRPRQRNTTPTAPKATEPTAPATASTKSRTRSGGATAPVEEAKTKASEPAKNSRRTSRGPATEPTAAKAPASKAKSKAKAADTETTSRTSTRNRSRPEAKVEPKKKATSTAKSSNRDKAAPKASPAKKSPPPTKANPNKPDWVVPPPKKKKD
jgi:predicted methyltransferase